MKQSYNWRLAGLLPVIALFALTSVLGVSTFAAPSARQVTPQAIADIGLRLPFRPGSEWTTTAGWEGGDHQTS